MTSNRSLRFPAIATLLGLAMLILAPISPTSTLVEGFLDVAHLPLDGGETLSTSAAGLLNAILGGVLVGFGTLIWGVSGMVFAKDMALGRQILLPAIVGWFVFDSLGSILAGAGFNAVLNLVFFAWLTAPLMWPAERRGER